MKKKQYAGVVLAIVILVAFGTNMSIVTAEAVSNTSDAVMLTVFCVGGIAFLYYCINYATKSGNYTGPKFHDFMIYVYYIASLVFIVFQITR